MIGDITPAEWSVEKDPDTGRKVTPQDFRSVRTVSDLATVVQRLMHA